MKPYYRILRLNHGRAPTVQHATLKDAETEALRLAGQHPGETFEILKVLGLARTTEPSIFWNDGVEPPEPGDWKRDVVPGDGYRMLEPEDCIEPGDEYATPRGAWMPHLQTLHGLQYGVGSFLPTRRKLPAPEHYPTTPLPEGFDRWVCRGEAWKPGVPKTYARYNLIARCFCPVINTNYVPLGNTGIEYWEAVKDEPSYRMLELGEQVLPGDEYYRGTTQKWVPTVCRAEHDYRVQQYDVGSYRRPISKP